MREEMWDVKIENEILAAQPVWNAEEKEKETGEMCTKIWADVGTCECIMQNKTGKT
jgi:hypothetical protein